MGDVIVQDAEALRAAALRVLDGAIVIGSSVAATDDEPVDLRDEVASSSAVALEWCLEPTLGLEPLLEADAVQIVALEISVEETTAAQFRASWTVSVKLRDVPAVRELASATCPDTEPEARATIEATFAAAWHWAAEPYGPLRGVPGVVWSPVEVTVEQIPARSR